MTARKHKVTAAKHKKHHFWVDLIMVIILIGAAAVTFTDWSGKMWPLDPPAQHPSCSCTDCDCN